MRQLRLLPLGVLALAALFVGPAPVAQAVTFTVDSTLDTADASPGDGACDDGSGNCTQRAAMGRRTTWTRSTSEGASDQQLQR